ncbi:hypothetical protein PoB_004061700 [Plakobranchus ocellatus]|uniref:Uncharacterized protein n=1 Tax=Plakobranchus ocellatus TaxID=259542 RepID=A0AAV4B4I1_9GAST|nr:hypothetical protein PoB_004061700 [Plakobranchus ocellatus]
MSFSKKNVHAVFLIDTQLASCANCKHSNEVLLVVNRILSAVREKTHHRQKISKRRIDSDKIDNAEDIFFRWGYKLFSTGAKLPIGKSDSASFQNLYPAYISAFETKLHSVFQDVSNSEMAPSTEKRRSLSHPSHLLSTALTEILHDFTWTNGEDLALPVGHGKKKLISKLDSVWCNSVFVLSRAPLTDKSLRLFANKKVEDSDVLIDSFMTPALWAEYQGKLNIAVSWIDMGSRSCPEQIQFDSLDKCTSTWFETCSKLGGTFLSKKSIINNLPALLHEDEAYKREGYPSGEHHLRNKGHCLSTESHLLDLLFPTTNKFPELQEKGIPASISISCFGLQNVMINLMPVSKMLFCGKTSELQTPRHLPLRFGELLEASLTLLGHVQDRDLSGKMMQHVSQSFILTVTEDSKALTQYLKILEISNTLAMLQVTLQKSISNALAVLRSTESGYFLSLLYMGCQQNSDSNTCSVKKRKELLHKMGLSGSQTLSGKEMSWKVYTAVWKSLEKI